MKYIKKFQRQHGLVPDGIIGKRTLTKMLHVFNIQSKIALSHFLGQIAEETGNFNYGVENLNYSATGLQRIFGRYFPTRAKALEYARNPEKIANYVYADKNRRFPLGNTQEGDGWKFRGRGAIQITGRTNYQEFADYIGDCQIMTNPEIVEKKYYWETALWYFKKRNIWSITKSVDDVTIKQVTRRVNGGYNGLAHRKSLTYHFWELLQYLVIDE